MAEAELKVEAQTVAMPVEVAVQVHAEPSPHESSFVHEHAPVTRT